MPLIWAQTRNNMRYEFKVNGTVKLTIEPTTNLERELFKELFSGEVSVMPTITTAPSGEITILKVKESK